MASSSPEEGALSKATSDSLPSVLFAASRFENKTAVRMPRLGGPARVLAVPFAHLMGADAIALRFTLVK